MRIVVHDFSGHPGQVQLSRELARRGHTVEHQYCASFTTGQGATQRRPDDPETFSVRPTVLAKEFARYSPLVRIGQELKYAGITLRTLKAANPDVVVFSNVPIAPLLLLTLVLRLCGVPYVFWWQDVYSEAMAVVARRRLGRTGTAIGWLLDRVERTIAKHAAAIVPITDAFLSLLARWDIDASKAYVIPNWGAIDEMPVRPRENSWSRRQGLVDGPVVMYAGTLGIKHDPSVLVRLAESMPSDSHLVVVSQGKGREWLEDNGTGDPRLKLLDYQPYDELPEMLASADVLLTVLEREASRYSVPSKVLNYLCAGRPVLAVLPADNAAAQMIESAGAGLVIGPDDYDQAGPALNRLLADSDLRHQMGTAARRFAEDVFDIRAVGARFESLIQHAYDRRGCSKRFGRRSAIQRQVL